ncbi:winged helix-turn-helix transcriptional regulator [Cerasicoccus maritimus]|uniref:winged helix-turn-helix transcriptional regulator n=1 Tax=Cerasicoccus maritimus TaxID=490089 RepID=UPI002852C47E|nr:helix-turn-helix domain-containing protein [Cerasicoccus maritimus]
MKGQPSGRPKAPEVVDPLQEQCGVRAALDVIRGRWKPFILYELHLRRCRYSELQAAMPQVSAQALSKQLRELERDGIVARRVTEDSPPRTVYELTEYGWTLGELMDRLEEWGNDFLKRRG